MKAPECDGCHTSNTVILNSRDNSVQFECMTCQRRYLVLPPAHRIEMNPVKNKNDSIENTDEIKIGSSSSNDTGLGIFPAMPYPLELMAVTEMMSSSIDSSSDCSSSDSSSCSSGDF